MQHKYASVSVQGWSFCKLLQVNPKDPKAAVKEDLGVALHWVEPFTNGDIGIRINIEDGPDRDARKRNMQRTKNVYKGLQSILNVISICTAASVPHHVKPEDAVSYLMQSQEAACSTGGRGGKKRKADVSVVSRTRYIDMVTATLRRFLGNSPSKVERMREHLQSMILQLHTAMAAEDFAAIKDRNFAMPADLESSSSESEDSQDDDDDDDADESDGEWVQGHISWGSISA